MSATTIQTLAGFKEGRSTALSCKLCKFEISVAQELVRRHAAAADAAARDGMTVTELEVLDMPADRRREREQAGETLHERSVAKFEALRNAELAALIGDNGVEMVERSKETPTSWSDGSGSRMATHMHKVHNCARGDGQLAAIRAHASLKGYEARRIALWCGNFASEESVSVRRVMMCRICRKTTGLSFVLCAKRKKETTVLFFSCTLVYGIIVCSTAGSHSLHDHNAEVDGNSGGGGWRRGGVS